MTNIFAANEIHDNEKFSLLGGYGLGAGLYVNLSDQ